MFSEIAYIYIRESVNAPTQELKRSPELVKSVSLSDLRAVLLSCEVLEETRTIVEKAFEYIGRYGLLPNDALVLATAKLNDCALATFDDVLASAAEAEGLKVIGRREN